MASDLDLIVVGGGPAGMMAGLLFARAGCRVRVLEKHADFFRDFRGDTVHPSTMEILDQLGMLERFLKRPHDASTSAELRIAGREWTIGDLSHLDTPAPFIAMMPQWDFLDFLRDEAKAFPGFELAMERAGRPASSRSRAASPASRLAGRRKAARAADDRRRRPRLDRPQRMLPLEDLGAPMDVFWFRIAKGGTDKARLARQRRARAVARDDRPRRLLAMRLPDPQGRGGGLSGARDRGDPRGGRGGGSGRPRPRPSSTRSPTCTC